MKFSPAHEKQQYFKENSCELLGTLEKDDQQPSLAFKQLPEDSDYLIYNDGKVFSKKTNRFLVGKIDNVGYRVYALAIRNPLSDKKLSKLVYAHRLVAQLFIDNPNNYSYVRHKDGNKLNNQVSNLEWSENCVSDNRGKRSKPRYYTKDLPGEIWKVIPEQLNYSVSSFGRVRNNRTNRLLKIDNNQKYSRVSFADKRYYYLHRLVYCVFNNDYNLDGFVIDHIDNDPRNNKLSNLQKITQSENCLKQERFND